MPIDMRLWTLIQENKAAIIYALRRRFDPSFDSDDPIFNEEGQSNYKRFANSLIEHELPWPLTASGQLDMSDDAFDLMQDVPGVRGIYILRNSLRIISGARELPIGPDGINRPKIFPFCTSTGGNAHAQSLFNCHAGLRGLIKFPERKIGSYCDVRTQEAAVAAVKSGDQALMDAYRSGDVYHGFALDAGMTTERNKIAWMSTPEGKSLRQRLKSMYLAINYGMGVPSLARKLNRHPLVAAAFFDMHRQKYRQFWSWPRKYILERNARSPHGERRRLAIADYQQP
jgi:hypothetical protein